MERGRDLAIVLRSVLFQDRHRIVTALTESHGRVSALARNAVQSRRFGGCLDSFAASEWHFTQKPGADLWQLERAEIRRSYEGLGRDFDRLATASVFTELMLSLTPEHEPCPELFKLHANALAALETDDAYARPLARVRLLCVYLAKLLQQAGHQPQTAHCQGCETLLENLAGDADLAVLVPIAGWICPSCRASGTSHVGGSGPPLRVTAEAMGDLARFLALPVRQAALTGQAGAPETAGLFETIEALATYHLPGFDAAKLKALRFMPVVRP